MQSLRPAVYVILLYLLRFLGTEENLFILVLISDFVIKFRDNNKIHCLDIDICMQKESLQKLSMMGFKIWSWGIGNKIFKITTDLTVYFEPGRYSFLLKRR